MFVYYRYGEFFPGYKLVFMNKLIKAYIMRKRAKQEYPIHAIENQFIINYLRVPPSKEPGKNPRYPNLCTVDQARTSSPDSTVFDIGERSIIHPRNGNFAKLR